MTDPADITIRPARRRDLTALVEFFQIAPSAQGATDHAEEAVLLSNLRNQLVAVREGEIIGSVLVVRGAGRCAAIRPPWLLDWDAELAARLLHAAAAHGRTKHGARLIQSLINPAAAQSLVPALERAGFAPLATLSYLRRAVQPEDANAAPDAAADLTWQHYSRLRHRRFAATTARTYTESLDCPGLVGLRTVNDAIDTHKHTGRFKPRCWHLVLDGDHPVGVALVNHLKGRGELVYLGVVPEARSQGLGRILLSRAIHDTAAMGLRRMGLAVDVANTPAVRLYETAGFHETHRRLAWFIPAERLDSLTGM